MDLLLFALLCYLFVKTNLFIPYYIHCRAGHLRFWVLKVRKGYPALEMMIDKCREKTKLSNIQKLSTFHALWPVGGATSYLLLP